MISLPRIERLAAAGRFDTLLDAVLDNGRSLPIALRLRLADPDTLPITALALALSRFLELTLGPTPQALTIARALIDRQHPTDDAPGPAAARGSRRGQAGHVAGFAATAAALTDLIDTLVSAPTLTPEHAALLADAELARDNALAALRSARDNTPSALLGQPLLGDEADTLLALTFLAHHPDLASAIDAPALIASLEDLGLTHDRALAPVLARAAAALAPPEPAPSLPPARKPPARSAIAHPPILAA